MKMRSSFRFSLLLFVGLLSFGRLSCSETIESRLKLSVAKEINEQILLVDSRDDLQTRISSAVSAEIGNQFFAGGFDSTSDPITTGGFEGKKGGKKGYRSDERLSIKNQLYKVPKWPVQSYLFSKKDMIGFFVNVMWATQAYGNTGGTRDISSLVFGADSFCVKDILLASRLIDKGLATVATSKYAFLETLKDQKLCFDASLEQQEVAFSYIRHFLDGDISLGLLVPFIHKRHKLKFQSALSSATLSTIKSNNPEFFDLYPNGLLDFFKDILDRKNIAYNECDSCVASDVESGLGDIEMFFNFEVMSRHLKHCFFGAHLLFPTAKRRDVYKLWDPELGNGGFTELSAFSSLMFSKGRWFNPHLFAQVTFPLSSKVCRRVPLCRQTSDVDASAITNPTQKYGDCFTPYGNHIQYPVAGVPTFSELDVTVRRFADTVSKTRLRPGIQGFLRIGNMFERIFHKRIFFDFFYDLLLKGKDYIGYSKSSTGGIITDCSCDASVLTKNSHEVSHRVGCNWSYQFDDEWRMHLGGLYKFAGRNTLKSYEIEGALTFEF